MPLDVRPLCASLQAVACDELDEDPDKLEEVLAEVRQWIEETPHLKARTDDQFLMSFLRGCKFKLEKVKLKLDMFYTLRTHIPELLLGRDPSDPKIRAIIKLGVGLPLPNTENSSSARVILIRPRAYNPDLFTIEDVIKVSTMINDVLLREDDNIIVAGQIGILDLANVSVRHFSQFRPAFIKKMTMMSEDGSPIRQIGFHYINTPPGFEQVFNVFKSVMNEESKTRLHVHGNNMESLYKIIPRRLMPEEYGGEAGPIQDIIDEWEKKLLSYRQYFQEDEEQFGVDESKRVGSQINPESLFGVENDFD